MSLRQLRTLLAIQTHGSFSAAAAACHITHAAVSQQMQALESLWEITLFDRKNQRPELTPIGRAMASKAAGIIRDYDGILASVIGEQGFQGELVLGAVPTTLTGQSRWHRAKHQFTLKALFANDRCQNTIIVTDNTCRFTGHCPSNRG